MSEEQRYESGSREESVFAQLQLGFNTYVQDLNVAWGDLQKRLLDLQLEYQRSLLQAWQSQSLQDFQTMQQNYQNALQNLVLEYNMPKSSIEAFTKYLGVIQNAMTRVDLKTQDPMTLAALSQSLSVISQLSCQISRPTSAQADTPGSII
jgi:hypothetical protein